MRYFLSFFLLFAFIGFSGNAVYGQDVSSVTDTAENDILFRKEMTFSISAHTNGFGIGYRIGKNKTYFQKRMFEIDFLQMKSSKEIRRNSELDYNNRRYIYGKENYLFILRGGYGAQKLLAQKPYWGGLEVRAFWYGGLSLGITKPYYLLIANYIDPNGYAYTLETERYDPEKHFPSYVNGLQIYSHGPFLAGIDEIKFYPGLYTKFGFNVEFGRYTKKVKVLEVGAALDGYPKAIPIMAFNPAYHYFLTAYVSFNFGKRYN